MSLTKKLQRGADCPSPRTGPSTPGIIHEVLQGQELGYRTRDSAAVATSQSCEARNMQYAVSDGRD